MKKILFIICLFPTFLFGQDKIIDSLNIVLKLAKHDTTKAITLVALSENLFPFNPDTVIPLCENALYIIENNLPKANGQIRKTLIVIKSAAINNLGFIYYQKNNWELALKYFSQSLQISIQLNDYESIGLAYRNISGIYKEKGEFKKSVGYSFKSLTYYSKANFKEGIANELNDIGFYYNTIGDTKKAIEYYLVSLKIYEEIDDKRGISASLNNLGVIYSNLGDIKKSLDYYQKSLSICEKAGEKSSIAYALNNIGMIYLSQKDYLKAIEYLKRSLKYYEDINDKSGIALIYNNISNAYDKLGDQKSCLNFLLKSIKISEEIGDLNGLEHSYNNIGSVYLDNNKDSMALFYYEKALANAIKTGHNYGKAQILGDIAAVYQKQKKYYLALKYALEAYNLSNSLHYPEIIRYSALVLKKIYVGMNEHQKALEMYEVYVQMRDSILNEENQKFALKNQLKYEFDKKTAADSVKVAEEKKVVMIQLKQEKTQRYALYGGLGLFLMFGIFIYNRLKITQRQKQVIEIKELETQQQKHIIEEKQREIIDSINYAERIQRSFLASKELLDKNLSDYFILFKPKDIVSGDFYWSATLKNGQFALVTADSTGHGVPGAIMSLLNISSLELAVKDQLTEPAQILNYSRREIIERLKKDGSAEGGKDGMDCSLCVYDFQNMKLYLAAANNPVWIVRGEEVIEIMADKMPVGKHDKQDIPFAKQSVDLKHGDVIYTLTDGFPDQFGGEKGKKFMSKNLRELLAKIAHLPLQEQKALLENTFTNWVGKLEQVDDVTIIGVRV
jgi:serine phosphatase RsbU (regulator of sigma subunit)